MAQSDDAAEHARDKKPELPRGPSADPTLTTQQAMLYAADVARLYNRVRKDEARLTRLEGRLRDLARVSLNLLEAASAEAAAYRLATDLNGLLGVSRSAVFVLRNARYRLLAHAGAAPAKSSLTREEAGEAGPVGMRSGNVWAELGMKDPVLVLPFPGRSGSLIGLAAVEAPFRAEETSDALELLARFAGVLLESLLIEEARLDARRHSPSAVMHREAAVAPLLGDSEPMKKLRQLVLQVASVNSPVLIQGETGTGKELVARAIHEASQRRKGPFVAVNCGALPENLVESEIFGHEVGAFTGASKRRRGKVELAQAGTLFLDELGEMPRSAQVKLLRFLQDSRYVPLGAETERPADVRVLAATNKALDAAVAAGDFREDLFYRLNVFTIDTPPLRDRDRDVVSLARSFARELAERLERPVPDLTAAAEQALLAYPWPGNVRELRNVIERAVVLAAGDAIDAALLPRRAASGAMVRVGRDLPTPAPLSAPEPSAAPPASEAASAEVFLVGEVLPPFAQAKDEFLARFEARYCEAVLAKTGGNIAQAARLANMDKKNLYRKIRAYGLDAAAHKRHP